MDENNLISNYKLAITLKMKLEKSDHYFESASPSPAEEKSSPQLKTSLKDLEELLLKLEFEEENCAAKIQGLNEQKGLTYEDLRQLKQRRYIFLTFCAEKI